MKPYTYLIGWSKLDLWYYGVRYSKSSDPNQLWETYFTSSNHVQGIRESEGEPDVIQIRKVFDCRDKAIEWESKVLRRMKVLDDERWLNKSVGGYFYYEGHPSNKSGITWDEYYGKETTDGIKNKLSVSLKAFWDSEAGQRLKTIVGERAKTNPNFTTKGMKAHNRIEDTFELECEFCGTKQTLLAIKSNTKKKTCGSKSCAAKWCAKYKSRKGKMKAHNKIADTYTRECEFCDYSEVVRNTAKNRKKKTCGSKSCAAKYANKYVKGKSNV